MLLTILGANGTYPTPGRPASGYLVQQGDTRVWIDAGPGTFAALQDRMDFRDLDAVVLSHIHPDHCVDVLALYHAAYFGFPRRTGLAVLAPDGVSDQLGAFLDAGPDHGFWEAFEFSTVGEGTERAIGDLTLRFRITDHSVPTVSVRMESDGRALTYSSDTGPGGGTGALAAGSDLFLCEATYQGEAEDKPWAHHLTAAEAGSMARQAEVDRLFLTHLWPTLDPGRSISEAERTFGRPVSLAVPGIDVRV